MKYTLKRKPINSSGQTTIEYILVLIIVVAIILGLVFQFNDAFKVYARNYFGAYLQCLLENGELPNLGAQITNSTCDTEFQAFNIANGRPPVGLGDGGFGEIAGGGSGSSNADGGITEPGSAGEDGGASAGGRPASFNSGSGGAGLGASGRNLRPATFSGTSDSEEQETSEGGGTVSTRRVIRRNADGTPTRRERGFADSGRQSYFRASKIEEEAIPANEVLVKESFQQSPVIRNQAVQQEMANRTIQSEESQGLTFSNFIKYLLIAALIIAIVLFLAGQFMSISKSMEK